MEMAVVVVHELEQNVIATVDTRAETAPRKLEAVQRSSLKDEANHTKDIKVSGLLLEIIKLVDTLNHLKVISNRNRSRDANIAHQNTELHRLNSGILQIPPLEALQVNLHIRDREDINNRLSEAKVIRAELRNLKALNSQKLRVPAQI